MSTIPPSAQVKSEISRPDSGARVYFSELNGCLYFLILAIVLCLAAYIRITYTDLDRSPLPGDEHTYHNAAKSILSFGYMVREPFITDGNLSDAKASTMLSPGYPMFLAAIYSLWGESFANVIAVQLVLSILSLVLAVIILTQLKVRKMLVVLALAFLSVYPAFLYNTDRLLTENLFAFVMLGFVIAFMSSLRTGRAWITFLAALVIAYAIHVRVQALPFALLAMLFYLVYGQGSIRKRSIQTGVFLVGVIAEMAPYWAHNFLIFGRVVWLPEVGDAAMIWGAVPYFLDMGATNGRQLAEIVTANSTPAPLKYWNWRIFGYMQQSWGDVWDERLVHAQPLLRPWLLLQHLVIIPTVMALPFLARRADPRILFIAAVPLALTYMNAPFHGLPRYVFPAIPFVFIIFAVLLDKVIERYTPASNARVGAAVIQAQSLGWDKTIRTTFLCASVLASVVILFSTYIFSWNIHKEMSAYRLARYMGVDLADVLTAKKVVSFEFLADALPIANTTKVATGVYINEVDAPPLINVAVPDVGNGGGERIVSKITLNISAGFFYDYMTVYWKSASVKEFSENHVYGRFPVNFLERKQTIHVDDDVTELLIVPAGFRGGVIRLKSIHVDKYDLSK